MADAKSEGQKITKPEAQPGIPTAPFITIHSVAHVFVRHFSFALSKRPWIPVEPVSRLPSDRHSEFSSLLLQSDFYILPCSYDATAIFPTLLWSERKRSRAAMLPARSSSEWSFR